MNPLYTFGTALAVLVSICACQKQSNVRPVTAPAQQQEKKKPADQKPSKPGYPTLSPDTGDEEKKKPDTATEPIPDKKKDPIPSPTPRQQPEYGIKVEGKTGYVKSPYDPAGRPIDARGLPPGTEIEDPYVPGRTLLVP